MSMKENDPYVLDEKEHKKIQEENKGGSSGVFCPRRNLSIGGKCSVCETVQMLFNSDDPKDREIAYAKMAKANFYMNHVLKSNPEKSTILEVGKKAGNEIIELIDQGWKYLAHPHAGKGHDTSITKRKGDGGWNTYRVSPMPDKADWAVSEEVLANLPNLDKILQILSEREEEVYRISELKMDETYTFRICPPWDNGAGNRRALAVVWRHYGGVTQSEIDGEEDVNLSIPQSRTNGKEEKKEEVPWEDNSDKKDDSSFEEDKREGCFGMKNIYEADDPTCKDCKDYRDCGREIARS